MRYIIQRSKFKIQNFNSKIRSKKTFGFLLALLPFAFCLLTFLPDASAQSTPPTSTNYKILNYGFGGGGTASSSSTNYSVFGTVGEVEFGSPASSTYFLGAGLEYTMTASEPAVPTFTNPSNWYNKLKLTINTTGTDPTDYQYAIRIASGSGAFQYVQSDDTISSAFPQSSWQSYTYWGGTNGTTLIGLYPGTTYTVQVAARQSQFYTQSNWGPTALAATSNPTFSFALQTTSESVPPFSVNIGTLTPGGSVAVSSDKVTATVTTNGNNGAIIYIQGTNTGLKSTTAANYTIPSSSSNLAALQEGYGARGTTATQTSGGPMELLSPYANSGNTVGILDTTKRELADSTQTPVTNGQASFELQAKAKNTTPSASDYSDLLTIIGTGDF